MRARLLDSFRGSLAIPEALFFYGPNQPRKEKW